MKRPTKFRIPFFKQEGFIVPINSSPLTINGILTVAIGEKRIKVSLPIALENSSGMLVGRAAITAKELKALLPDDEHGALRARRQNSDNAITKTQQTPKRKKLVKKPVAPEPKKGVLKPRKEEKTPSIESRAQQARNQRKQKAD